MGRISQAWLIITRTPLSHCADAAPKSLEYGFLRQYTKRSRPSMLHGRHPDLQVERKAPRQQRPAPHLHNQSCISLCTLRSSRGTPFVRPPSPESMITPPASGRLARNPALCSCLLVTRRLRRCVVSLHTVPATLSMSVASGDYRRRSRSLSSWTSRHFNK